MKKHFYHHLIQIDSFFVELSALDIAEDEKKHIVHIVESTMHQQVLDLILSELEEKDKKKFVQLLRTNDHYQLWSHLTKKIVGIEKKITDLSKELKQELRSDIKEA